MHSSCLRCLWNYLFTSRTSNADPEQPTSLQTNHASAPLSPTPGDDQGSCSRSPQSTLIQCPRAPIPEDHVQLSGSAESTEFLCSQASAESNPADPDDIGQALDFASPPLPESDSALHLPSKPVSIPQLRRTRVGDSSLPQPRPLGLSSWEIRPDARRFGRSEISVEEIWATEQDVDKASRLPIMDMDLSARSNTTGLHPLGSNPRCSRSLAVRTLPRDRHGVRRGLTREVDD